jgi:uncharacterized protein YhbP (UPF0306 family)
LDLRQQALSYLESHHVMTLATYGTGGPWATAVFYVNDGFNLSFLTEDHTRHGRNLAADPRVAVAVHEDYADWRSIKGLQIQGRAKPLSQLAKAGTWPAFLAKFPTVGVFVSDARYMAVMARARVYRLEPEEIWFLDNAKGFSRRERISPR